MWSNPDADDSVLIRAALLKPSFHQLLEIAARFGIDRLRTEWTVLTSADELSGFPEEVARIRRAKPIVERCLAHINKAIR